MKKGGLSKADIRAKLTEINKKDSLSETTLRNISSDIGTSYKNSRQIQQEVDRMKTKVTEEINQSIEEVDQITSIHFSTQKEYEQRMNRLKDKIAILEGQLRDAEKELADLKEEKHRVLFEKDSVIENQKREMKEMAYQFSDMLMKTLITITENFEVQSNEMTNEDIKGLPDRDRLREFNLDHINI